MNWSGHVRFIIPLLLLFGLAGCADTNYRVSNAFIGELTGYELIPRGQPGCQDSAPLRDADENSDKDEPALDRVVVSGHYLACLNVTFSPSNPVIPLNGKKFVAAGVLGRLDQIDDSLFWLDEYLVIERLSGNYLWFGIVENEKGKKVLWEDDAVRIFERFGVEPGARLEVCDRALEDCEMRPRVRLDNAIEFLKSPPGSTDAEKAYRERIRKIDETVRRLKIDEKQ